MAKFVKGDVVIIPFPFSDLSNSRKRPALVIAKLSGDDLILCQITSQNRKDDYVIPLEKNDFKIGNLPISSYIRPNKIFTGDKNIILSKAGTITNYKLDEATQKIIDILKA